MTKCAELESKLQQSRSAGEKLMAAVVNQIAMVQDAGAVQPLPVNDSKKKRRQMGSRIPNDKPRVPIDDLETKEVMAAFRKVCKGRGAMTREELLRDAAQVFGYKRLGSSVGHRLKGHLRAAIRRGIVEADGECVGPATRTVDDYTRDFLIETLHSMMRAGKFYDREEVIRAAAEHLGFSKVNERIRGAFPSAIRKGVSVGRIISDRNTIWRL